MQEMDCNCKFDFYNAFDTNKCYIKVILIKNCQKTRFLKSFVGYKVKYYVDISGYCNNNHIHTVSHRLEIVRKLLRT